MKKFFLFTCIVLGYSGAFGQPADSLSLEMCIRIADQRSPLNTRKSLAGEALNYKIRNLGTRWLPAVGINAQAQYNSETVDFSGAMKNLPVSIPSLPLDQYKVWADINQSIYDGGMIHAQKSVERAGYETDVQQIRSDLVGVKQQVSQAYFGWLTLQKNAEVIQVSLDQLGERKKVIQAGIDNGAVLPENLQSLEAEQLKLQQQLIEMRLNQQKFMQVLTVLMDTTFDKQVGLIRPAEPARTDSQILRPEYELFNRQKEKLQASEKLITAADMPKFFAFSQGAYGRPGYNLLSNTFHTYYSVGVGMKWDFLHYGDSRRQKELIRIQQDMVDVQKKTFDDQLSIQLANEVTNEEKYTELIRRDEQIMNLRKSIAAASFAKLNHGVITATDYLTDLDNEILARLSYESHKIMKLQAEYNYLLLQGKL